ncbi:DUF5777 family beta-barrel protein [Flavobacterium sp. SUN046]|uniref:DUF5777 family beta-barrel protein n=1 Tax=Flavobacterium sp. SUN046 TaxID=3002440 RepID=UPI002DBC8F46|nr:DUF5777 family beta-barrel protein [Flavobacterium sp. SUN046]MEC4049450.1 DUF5777 family beta-barrel protein [Flavobacterium sp. SUN046]
MKLLKITLSALFLFSFGIANAQDDLMKELDATKSDKKEITSAAFKGLQVVNMQSTKLPVKGEFYFLVSHRFGDLTYGLDNFYGLDGAYTKLGGIYGVTDWLSLGLSRHTFQKTYEFAAKYKLANQEDDGFPVTIVGYNTMDIRSDLKTALYPDLKANDRYAYSTQLIVSRKINSSLSLQVNPMFIHKNLYDELDDQKNTFLLGTGARCKVSKRISINLDYAARLNLPEGYNYPYHNPISLGMDIETGGHVFQLVFSNSQAMNDVSYYTSAAGITGGRGIFFGFNMYRVF